MKRIENLDKYHTSFQKRFDYALKTNKGMKTLLSTITKSQQSNVAQILRQEDKLFDKTWLDNLEEGMNAIDSIINNPRRFLKEERQIVPVALAKRVNSESLIHLSSHTELIHFVDENGNVIPDRIMSISMEDDYQIYENRFIMTLVNKLIFFIEKRYEFVHKHGETFYSETLDLHSKIKLGEMHVEIDNRIKMIIPSSDEGKRKENEVLLARLDSLRKRATFYLGCPLMQKLKDSRPVSTPIMKTNILMKDRNYHQAYKLWEFLDNYTKLGVSFKVRETKKQFNDAYLKEIYKLYLANILTIESEKLSDTDLKNKKSRRKVFIPKVNKEIDDKIFNNTRFLYRDEEILKKQEIENAKLLAKEKEEILQMKEAAQKEKNKIKDELAKSIAKEKKKAFLELKAIKEKIKKEQKKVLDKAKAEEKARLLKQKKDKEAREKRKKMLEERREAYEKELLERARKSVHQKGITDRLKDRSTKE